MYIVVSTNVEENGMYANMKKTANPKMTRFVVVSERAAKIVSPTSAQADPMRPIRNILHRPSRSTIQPHILFSNECDEEIDTVQSE